LEEVMYNKVGSSLFFFIGAFLCAVIAFFAPVLLDISVAQAAGLVSGGGSSTNATTIAENIVGSVDELPGLISAISYLMALAFGATGIIKLKEHVENPQQASIKEVASRFGIGGALLSLPMVYEAMRNTIGNGEGVSVGSNFTGFISGLMGTLTSFVPAQDFNQVLSNIMVSMEGIPAFIAALAYICGLIMGVWGLSALKAHIENPQQNPIKEAVVRLLIGGALFAIPTVYMAMASMIGADGDRGIFDMIGEGLDLLGMVFSSQQGGLTCSTASFGFLGGLLGGSSGSSMGGVVCNVMLHTSAVPGFLAALSYLAGIVLGIWGLFKLRDHVLNPQQVQAWDAFSKFLAGGAFLAMPIVIDAVSNTMGIALTPHMTTGFNDGSSESGGLLNSIINLFGGGGETIGEEAGGGLDVVLMRFMNDMANPLTQMINYFAMIAGTIFVMIGVSRLLKSSQDGPRGPGGAGTVMTFLIGGALLSFSPMMSAMSMSLFNSPFTQTFGALSYTEGIDPGVLVHSNAVIAAMVKFMLILGLMSFARGLFIVREVAEGGQASIMAGITHIIGGAMAVNIGPVINAVQTTLGLTQYGVVFS
jgi:hypothetical protein